MAISKPKRCNTFEIRLKVNGRAERFPGVDDKAITLSIQDKIRRLVLANVHHQSVPTEVLAWLRDLPTKSSRLFGRLVECGLADSSMLGRRRLRDLLFGTIAPRAGFDEKVATYHRNGNTLEQARRKVRALHPTLVSCEPNAGGYFQSLLADGDTPDHVLQIVSRIEAVLGGCGFHYWEDLNADSLKQWLHSQRSERIDFGHVTSNHYVKAMRAFAGWTRVKLKRVGEGNPFQAVKLLNPRVDVRRKRRVPTNDELARLIRSTETSGEVAGLPGIDRAMLYRVAMTIALRAGECASLTPESCFFREDGFVIRVEAAVSKRRREDHLIVPADLAALVRPWLATKRPGERLWPGLWHNDAAAMLRIDLAATEIAYETDEGVFDFHATRHTGITRGSKVMTLAQLKTFARHSKIETTMRYVHTDASELRATTDRLRLPTLEHPSDRQAHLEDAVALPRKTGQHDSAEGASG